MRDNGRTDLGIFVVGLGMGALIGFLFAPKSGEETREYLMGKAQEGKEYARRKAREVQDRAVDTVNRGKEFMAREMELVSDAINAGREAYYANKANGKAGTA